MVIYNNLTDINAAREKVRFKIGNHWSADADNPSATWWTESDDYIISYGEQNFYLSCAFYKEESLYFVEEITAPYMPENYVEISISDVPQAILSKVFSWLFPNGKEEEQFVFLYGLERGLELFEEKTWIRLHLLLDNEEITRKAMNRIGRWDEELYCEKPHSARVRQGQCCYEIYAPRLVMGKPENLYDVSIIVYDPLEEAQKKKAFGRKVRELANQAHVPFKIAALLWNLEDTNNIKALMAVHDARVNSDTLDDITRHELLECGIERRLDAIRRVLGDYTDFFRLDGQIKSNRLALFLAHKQLI